MFPATTSWTTSFSTSESDSQVDNNPCAGSISPAGCVVRQLWSTEERLEQHSLKNELTLINNHRKTLNDRTVTEYDLTPAVIIFQMVVSGMYHGRERRNCRKST